jgi:hypothetical protein
MAFCIKCGAQLGPDARFCEKCGTAAGAHAAGQPPQVAVPGAVPRKGLSPWVWIGGSLAVLLILIVIGIAGTGFFIAKKVHDAGFDQDLAQRNPVLAAAKMAASLNPEVEIVKVDEDAGVITIREKKTGKTVTMNAEDVKNGRISFTDESSGSTVSVGGDVNLPDWVPDYPGSKPAGTFSAAGGDSEAGMASFKTGDPADKVLGFYRDELKSAGFKITETTTSTAGGGMIAGEDEANRRTVTAVVSQDGGSTQVVLNYGTKK